MLLVQHAQNTSKEKQFSMMEIRTRGNSQSWKQIACGFLSLVAVGQKHSLERKGKITLKIVKVALNV